MVMHQIIIKSIKGAMEKTRCIVVNCDKITTIDNQL